MQLSCESRAYVSLETARLRCESLSGHNGHPGQLGEIHREIGLAGYVTSQQFDVEHRRGCLALAASRLVEVAVPSADRFESESPQVGRTLSKMFSETISASDALAAELAEHEVDEEHRDRLHLVHAHVMSACELLDERLTALELTSAGIDVS
jgi:hypothetical protein